MILLPSMAAKNNLIMTDNQETSNLLIRIKTPLTTGVEDLDLIEINLIESSLFIDFIS